MSWIAAGGATDFTNKIVVGDADEDVETTAAIRAAIDRSDFAAADTLFAAAQSIRMDPNEPSVSTSSDTANASSLAVTEPPRRPDPNVPDPNLGGTTLAAHPTTPERYQPRLTQGLRNEIATGDTKFFHIHLRDSCRNDGDVVEILINGQPTFLVPITNAGATLSVPLTRGNATVISVRGVYDGGGGITVACRSSRGEGFVRVMANGDIQAVGVIIK